MIYNEQSKWKINGNRNTKEYKLLETLIYYIIDKVIELKTGNDEKEERIFFDDHLPKNDRSYTIPQKIQKIKDNRRN